MNGERWRRSWVNRVRGMPRTARPQRARKSHTRDMAPRAHSGTIQHKTPRAGRSVGVIYDGSRSSPSDYRQADRPTDRIGLHRELSTWGLMRGRETAPVPAVQHSINEARPRPVTPEARTRLPCPHPSSVGIGLCDILRAVFENDFRMFRTGRGTSGSGRARCGTFHCLTANSDGRCRTCRVPKSAHGGMGLWPCLTNVV